MVLEYRKEIMLLPIIQQYIAPGSQIKSDFRKAYSNLRVHCYDHKNANDSKKYKAPYGIHTNIIEANWGGLKGEIQKNIRNWKNFVEHFL